MSRPKKARVRVKVTEETIRLAEAAWEKAEARALLRQKETP